MATIPNVSHYLAAASGTDKQLSHYCLDQRVGGAVAVAPVIGQFVSLWQYESSPGGAGIAPGSSVRIPTNATDGSLRQNNPPTGKQRWLTKFFAASVLNAQGGDLVLYDRLLDRSGLSGTNTSAQAIGGSLTRYSDAEAAGNEMWVEIYTQIGATGTTATVNYVNQSGSSVTSPAFAIGGTGLREAQRLIKVPFAGQDTGAREITDITLLATTGTVGDFGMMIARELLTVPVTRIAIGVEVPLHDKHIEIKTDACLALMFHAAAVAVPAFAGYAFFVDY